MKQKTFSLPEKLIAKIEQKAEETGLSEAEVVRTALIDQLGV